MNFDKLQGSIVAIVTPFKEDQSVDYDKFIELIEWHISQGTSGIVVCGTTAETPTLTEEECDILIKLAVKTINGRISVIAGSGSSSTLDSIRYSQYAEKEGVDALLVVAPYYNRPSTMGLFLHFSEIAKSVQIPVIIYNIPSRTGCNIPVELVLDLAKSHENISGIKEASGGFNTFMNLIEGRPNGFKVFSGDDMLSIPSNLMGADGCISVLANIIPYEFQKMMEISIKGNVQEARELFFKYKKLTELLFIETSPIPVKTAMAAMGKINETMRLPLCNMNSTNKKLLLNELARLGII